MSTVDIRQEVTNPSILDRACTFVQKLLVAHVKDYQKRMSAVDSREHPKKNEPPDRITLFQVIPLPTGGTATVIDFFNLLCKQSAIPQYKDRETGELRENAQGILWGLLSATYRNIVDFNVEPGKKVWKGTFGLPSMRVVATENREASMLQYEAFVPTPEVINLSSGKEIAVAAEVDEKSALERKIAALEAEKAAFLAEKAENSASIQRFNGLDPEPINRHISGTV